MTVLVVDGRVNTYRLLRNLVGGAIAGRVACDMAGVQKEKEAEKQAADQQTAYTAAHKEDVTDDESEALKKDIGPKNVAAFKSLILCSHEKVFKVALKTF